jgi:hypothetical protein
MLPSSGTDPLADWLIVANFSTKSKNINCKSYRSMELMSCLEFIKTSQGYCLVTHLSSKVHSIILYRLNTLRWPSSPCPTVRGNSFLGALSFQIPIHRYRWRLAFLKTESVSLVDMPSSELGHVILLKSVDI